MPGDTQGKLLLVYDPSLVHVCGGVAATLLYTWLEDHLFPPTAYMPVAVPSFRWLYESLAMRQGNFSSAIQTIAVVHLSPQAFQLAKIGNREFIHQVSRREVFYALVITRPTQTCIIHRNHSAIDNAFRNIDQRLTQPISLRPSTGKAQDQAKKMIENTALLRYEP